MSVTKVLRLEDKSPQFEQVVQKLRQAHSICLTTHRQADGDGLGSQIALYYALKKAGKNVRILNVDTPPKKYRFLAVDALIESFENKHQPLTPTDLTLVFDTNDFRLIEPLYSELQSQCKDIVFVDHHPTLASGPLPTKGSLIATSAASTGEITYFLIKALGIEFDALIAHALYASIVFDTQLFRYIRASANSHLIAAELLEYDIHAEDVHRALMANHTIPKISFLASALSRIEYYLDGRLAVLKLSDRDLEKYKVDWDESRDVIDLIMNIESLEAAVLFREDGTNEFKLSLRSKGNIAVLPVAEAMGGGGHLFSAGAFMKGSYEEMKSKILSHLTSLIQNRGSTP